MHCRLDLGEALCTHSPGTVLSYSHSTPSSTRLLQRITNSILSNHSRHYASSLQQRQTCSLHISPGATHRLLTCTKYFFLRQTRRLHPKAAKCSGVHGSHSIFVAPLFDLLQFPIHRFFGALTGLCLLFPFLLPTHGFHTAAQRAATKTCNIPALYRLPPGVLDLFSLLSRHPSHYSDQNYPLFCVFVGWFWSFHSEAKGLDRDEVFCISNFFSFLFDSSPAISVCVDEGFSELLRGMLLDLKVAGERGW